jgi:hypothetical protein
MTFKRPEKFATHRWLGGTSGGKFLPTASQVITPTAAGLATFYLRQLNQLINCIECAF